MAHLVSNRKSQKRTSRESNNTENNTIASSTGDLIQLADDNQNDEIRTSASVITSNQSIAFDESFNNNNNNNNTKSERSAKSKAKIAITHLLATSLNQKTKIDSFNSTSEVLSSRSSTSSSSSSSATGSYSFANTTSTIVNNNNGSSKETHNPSKGLKRSRSHSSTSASTSSIPRKTSRISGEQQQTPSSPQPPTSSQVACILDTTTTASNTVFYTTAHSNNNNNNKSPVPTKKPRYTSKINLNLSTSSGSILQSALQAQGQVKSSPTTSSTKDAATTSTNTNRKELGNTCASRPKDTTGSCLTKSILRRSQQQHDVATTLPVSTTATTSSRQTTASASSVDLTKKSSNPSKKHTPQTIIKQNFAHIMNQQQQQQQTTSSTTTATTNTTTTSTSAVPLPNAAHALPISESESDNDNSEFSRLTDILQARGLPTHIVNAFGTKVQQFLSRTISNGMPSRTQQLIQTLQQPDESLKLTALSEMCQLLVMGNEDTLIGFPIKQAVPLLIQCMNTDTENFDLMNHACRALTYMMESLPRSSSIIAEGIPVMLEKLQIIQCIDVAEQALTALEILSRRNSKQILHSNGISACLTFIDFFSIGAQRNALQITANCCQNMIKEEFIHIQSSLPILSQRIQHSDKRLVESVCTIFSRLAENFQHDRDILKEIASHSVLANMQQVLCVQPQLISSSIFVVVLHTMYIMCVNCTELATDLLHNNIADTLKYLLCGANMANKATSHKVNYYKTDGIELIPRPPQELFEIVSLICEIMPKLPNTGIFTVDNILKKSSSSRQQNDIQWQWKDERDIWRPYNQMDSSLIEASYRQEEDEVTLSTMGRTYVVDFNSMLQINEETGTARPVLRKSLPNRSNDNPVDDETTATKVVDPLATTSTTHPDYRLECLNTTPKLHADYVRALFGILYEVYSSSAGPAIKHRCLRALLRMMYYANEELLSDVLCNLTISSHIASMLASQDQKVIVIALQMSEILMQKLPHIFSIYFHREGVIHQIDELIEQAKHHQHHQQQQQQQKLQHDKQASESSTRPTRKTELTAFSMDTLLAADTQVKPRPTSTVIIADLPSKANQVSVSKPPMTKEADPLKRKVRGAPKRPGRTTTTRTKNPTDDATDDQPAQQPNTLANFHNIMSMTKLHSYLKGSSSSTSKIPVPTTTTSNLQTQTAFSNDLTTLKQPTTTTGQTPTGTYPLFAGNLWWNVKSTPSSLTNNNNNNNSTISSTAKPTMTHKYGGLYVPSIPLLSSSSSSTTTTTTTSQQPPANNSQRRRPNPTDMSQLATTTTALYNPLNDYNIINYNKEKVRQWIVDQAERFRRTYFPTTSGCDTIANVANDICESHPGLSILKRLNKAVERLSVEAVNHATTDSLDSLRDISNVIYETDISSFEMIHSGLITKLLDFLTVDNQTKTKRINQFLNVFVRSPLGQHKQPGNKAMEPIPDTVDSSKLNLLQNFTLKLHNCVNQLEQFAVRVHDMPHTAGYGKSAIKFFNTHQLKCMLQRAPESATSIRAWKGGPVKVDPLAVVTAIEKYLVMRGINKAPMTTTTTNPLATTTVGGQASDEDEDDDDDEDDEEDDDIEDALSTILGRNIDQQGPRLELLINGNLLPPNMTIYQAIRQFAMHADTDTENDNESFTNNEIWSKVHTIDYRVAANTQQQTATTLTTSGGHTSSTIGQGEVKTRSAQRTSTRNKTQAATSASQSQKKPSHATVASSPFALELVTCESNSKFFFNNLNNNWLKDRMTISDASLNAIALLRIVNLLNRYWHLLYTSDQSFEVSSVTNLQSESFIMETKELVNTKLAAKANRQLQDPLVIMTGHLPKWLPELVRTCPFLFPFETRLMYFYASSFDRDRAMQKLLDTNTDLNQPNTTDMAGNTNERIVPKLERKKKTIVRADDLIKQTETILNDFASPKSKALLEIQYENEVGTGLGPTLEFYALTSLEIQKADYDLWRGDKIKISTAKGYNQNSLFFYSPSGLYPAPLAKNTKTQLVTKIRNKFKVFGKFVAKAIMDFRVLDIHLSIAFYKWLIDHKTLNESDIKYIDAGLYRSLNALGDYLAKYKANTNTHAKLNAQLKADQHANKAVDSTTTNAIKIQIKQVECDIAKLNGIVNDLVLDFTLPGYSHIELKKGGKDVSVSLANLEEYIKLVVHWTLIEGVQRQFESFIEGFNSIFPIKSLDIFYPEELERLSCGSGFDMWDNKLLVECTRCDHGYTHDSKAVQFLFEIMCSFGPDEQRLFLQFVTGSPRLPVGGLRSLVPQLTIVRKTVEGNDGPDNYLPSVMTCVNYLKLPEYSNIDIMREKINTAITDGQLSFNLS